MAASGSWLFLSITTLSDSGISVEIEELKNIWASKPWSLPSWKLLSELRQSWLELGTSNVYTLIFHGCFYQIQMYPKLKIRPTLFSL